MVVLAVAGCSFHSGFDGTGYRCGDGDRCPDGFTCVAGYCRDTAPADAGGGDGGGGSDAGGDGGVVEARCGTLSVLRDDFADGVVGRQWDAWNDTGAITAETGGYLAIQIDAGSSDVWAGYTSIATYDLDGGILAAVVDQVGGNDTVLEARAWGGARAQMVVEDGTLNAAVYNTGNDGVRASVTYDGGQHHHWRIRGAGGRLYWETSVNGSSWDHLWDEPMPFAAGDVYGIIAAGGQLVAASEARYAELNPAPPARGACPTETFTDDFSAAPLTPAWSPWTTAGCSNAESGGDLVMTFDGAGAVWCGIASNHVFDLHDSELVIEVPEAPAASMFDTYAQLMTLNDQANKLEIGMENGSAWFEQDAGGSPLQSQNVTWDATAMRFWRFAESGGQIQLSTSPDGSPSSWTPRLTATAAFDLSTLQVVIGAGAYGTGPGTAQTVRIAGVNAP